MYRNPHFANSYVPSTPAGWVHTNTYFPQQKMSGAVSRVVPNRDVEFTPQEADSDAHGQGFKLYKWTFVLNPNEYLVCRLSGTSTERVISAGFATDPLAPVYAVENFPRHPHVWVTSLHNTSSSRLNLYLYLIVKV
ncbi:hypothetical protein GCM10010912_11190 [Paenibacillus albidus]|uniref:Uncharacterized protein n=1 Tax=Paenibacillus albidus TaxID=2041023 RepID=A0A917C1P0_9BACL|nr:hypothetical protein [Paenibacillus albidus]GGF67950.1 hypothetical protein GCM10010912_11190 [Paenibacillus albidus]